MVSDLWNKSFIRSFQDPEKDFPTRFSLQIFRFSFRMFFSQDRKFPRDFPQLQRSGIGHGHGARGGLPQRGERINCEDFPDEKYGWNMDGMIHFLSFFFGICRYFLRIYGINYDILIYIARGFGYTRAPWKASKRQSRKAAKPPWNAQAAKPQSRKAAMERASRKAAKPPWNAQAAKPQSRKAAKPQSRKAAKPPSRKLCDSCAASCVHRRCVATAMDRWSRKAAKPQSRKAAKPQALRRRLRLLCSSPLCCQSVKKRQRAAKRQGVEAPRSVKAAKLQEASRSVNASRSGTAPKRQRSANERLAVLRRGRACLRKEVCNQRLAVFRRDGLAYCETIRSEFRRAMADVMATPKRLKSSIRLNEWQFSFLFGWKILSTMYPPVW